MKSRVVQRGVPVGTRIEMHSVADQLGKAFNEYALHSVLGVQLVTAQWFSP